MAKRKKTDKKSLINKKFGRWTVIGLSDIKNYMFCKCECGTEKNVKVSALISGDSKSCGCLSKELTSQRNIIDISGQVFGNLVVIKRIEKPKNIKGESVYWQCQCICGKMINVSSWRLRSGTKKSCGCIVKISGPKKDLTGLKFGKLTVIKLDHRGKNNSGYYWLCLCDCGKEKVIAGSHLRNGNTKSCGCWKKIFNKFRNRENKTPMMRCESSFNALLGSYKARAKKKNLSFTLTKEEFKNLTSSNCYYCGTPPLQWHNRQNFDGYYIYNGIDRVDNNLGYDINNCVPCCMNCNKSKGTQSQSDFINWVYKIYNNIIEKNYET
jgi:hypothetical protein